jgi:multicomponent Na+:H+ antiporter subunit D
MVMVAAIEEGYPIVWLALLFASAGVFHHAGIKIPFFAFFAHDSGIRTTEPPRNMLIAMGIAAAICIFNGSYPWVLYSLLPFPVDYEPYTAAHVLTQSQLLFFSALAFCWLKLSGLYPPELPGINIDAEWLYRKAGPAVAPRLAALVSGVRIGSLTRAQRRLERFIAQVYRHHGPEGVLARTWTTGGTVLWVALLLGGYLIVYYL